MAKDGGGKGRQEVVDHAEPGDKSAAHQDVNRGREEEAGGRWDVREEDFPACGIGDAGEELDGRADEVEDEKTDEGGAAFLWPCGWWVDVHALAKVPSDAAHGEHELEGILRPGQRRWAYGRR